MFRGEHINFLAWLTLGQPAVCLRAIWTLIRAKSLCSCAFFLPKIFNGAVEIAAATAENCAILVHSDLGETTHLRCASAVLEEEHEGQQSRDQTPLGVLRGSYRERKFSPKFSDRSFWKPLRAVNVRAFGSWMSAPRCLFFQDFDHPDRSLGPGYPRE